MATRSVGDIKVQLTANISDFRGKMEHASKLTHAFSASLSRMTPHVAGFGKELLALATGGGMGYLIAKQMQFIDKSAKFADSMGLSTEAVGALQLTAREADVPLELMEKGIRRLQRAIGEAKAGMGEGSKGIRALGIDATAFSKLRTEDQILIIADRFKGLPSVAERAAIAMNLFGRSGAELLPMFSRGAEGLREFQAMANRTGVAVNRIDAAQVERFDDALKETRAIFEGITNQVVVKLAPLMESAISKFNEWATAGGGVKDSVGGAIDFVLTKIGDMIDGVDQSARSFDSITHSIGELWNAFVNVLDVTEKWFGTVFANTEGMNSDLEQTRTVVSTIVDAFKGLGYMVDWVQNRVENLKSIFSVTANAAAIIVAAFDPTTSIPEQRAIQKRIYDDTVKEQEKQTQRNKDFEKKFGQLAQPPAQSTHKYANFVQGARGKAQEFLNSFRPKKGMGNDDGLINLDRQKRAEDMFKSAMTPIQKYESVLGEANTLFKEHLLNWNEYSTIVHHAGEELRKAYEQQQKFSNGIFGSGSLRGARFNSPESRNAGRGMPQLQPQQARTRENWEMLSILRQIAMNTGPNGTLARPMATFG